MVLSKTDMSDTALRWKLDWVISRDACQSHQSGDCVAL